MIEILIGWGSHFFWEHAVQLKFYDYLQLLKMYVCVFYKIILNYFKCDVEIYKIKGIKKSSTGVKLYLHFAILKSALSKTSK